MKSNICMKCDIIKKNVTAYIKKIAEKDIDL